jgi:hypothetical protein
MSDGLNKNSMRYWLNEISTLGLPVPATIIVGLDDEIGFDRAVDSMGFPFFLRTDLCSGKHDWKGSCFVTDRHNLQQHKDKVLESNVRWQMLGIEPSAFIIREFLQLETLFTAFSGNMPINKERRYFVRDGNVVCSHPYWPASAFNNHPARMANDPAWEEKLSILNKRDETENCLTGYAEKVGRKLGGYWSIDFAKDRFGKWWLLDMALGDNSYHYPHVLEENK